MLTGWHAAVVHAEHRQEEQHHGQYGEGAEKVGAQVGADQQSVQAGGGQRIAEAPAYRRALVKVFVADGLLGWGRWRWGEGLSNCTLGGESLVGGGKRVEMVPSTTAPVTGPGGIRHDKGSAAAGSEESCQRLTSTPPRRTGCDGPNRCDPLLDHALARCVDNGRSDDRQRPAKNSRPGLHVELQLLVQARVHVLHPAEVLNGERIRVCDPAVEEGGEHLQSDA